MDVTFPYSQTVRDRHRWWWWGVFPLILLAAITWIVRASGFDLEAQKVIYRAGGESWALGDRPFWQGIYDHGVIPATVVVFAAMIALLPGLRPRGVVRWRRICVFLILLGVLGPGLVTNLILKEYWGRPRPRAVEGLGGTLPFEFVLSMDRSTGGKSFPCGHATMGFYFMGFFFLLHRTHRRTAIGFLLFGLLFGGLLGVARMLQGGHFFSDAVWAAGVCYFTAFGLYYALGFHRDPIEAAKRERPLPKWALATIAVAGLGVVAGAFLATPYREVRDHVVSAEHADEEVFRVELAFVTGEVRIAAGDGFRLVGEASGHGLPTSAIVGDFEETRRERFLWLNYRERLSGRFTEVSSELKVTLPWERMDRLVLDIGDAKVRILGDATVAGRELRLKGGEGEVVVSLPDGIAHRIYEGRGQRRYGGLSIVLLPEFEGTLRVE